MAGLSLRKEAPYTVGMLVERELDGQWYLARITSVNRPELTYTIEYLDDGNEEEDVLHNEVRPADSDDTESLMEQSIVRKGPPVAPEFHALVGLLAAEDGNHHKRSPRIIVHRCGSLEEPECDNMRIINAPDMDGLAVGVGIRGARYLRKGLQPSGAEDQSDGEDSNGTEERSEQIV